MTWREWVQAVESALAKQEISPDTEILYIDVHGWTPHIYRDELSDTLEITDD